MCVVACSLAIIAPDTSCLPLTVVCLSHAINADASNAAAIGLGLLGDGGRVAEAGILRTKSKKTQASSTQATLDQHVCWTIGAGLTVCSMGLTWLQVWLTATHGNKDTAVVSPNVSGVGCTSSSRCRDSSYRRWWSHQNRSVCSTQIGTQPPLGFGRLRGTALTNLISRHVPVQHVPRLGKSTLH
jgi:hypothetical protein